MAQSWAWLIGELSRRSEVVSLPLIKERRQGERRTRDRRRGDRRRSGGDRRLGPPSHARGAEPVQRLTGLLLIRAWAEPESSEPLRAHVRVTRDISIGIEQTFTAVDAAAVATLVEDWLRGIVDGQAPR